MKLLNLIAILFFVTASVNAGEVDDVLRKLRDKCLDAGELEYNTTYELFKGHTSSAVHSSYKGEIYRKNGHIYQKIDKTEFVHGDNFSLQISHGEQIVVLMDKQKNAAVDVDLTEVLKVCIEKTIETKNGYHFVTLMLGSNSPFSTVKLKIDKETSMLYQLDVYYSGVQDFSESMGSSDFAKPHLRIKFTDYNFNPTEEKTRFTLSNYIKNESSEISLQSKYEGYLLIDQRTK